jgi:hypothetical protein
MANGRRKYSKGASALASPILQPWIRQALPETSRSARDP